ncbi:hypothetical protein Tco_1343243 [Tanacetum coccineum]
MLISARAIVLSKQDPRVNSSQKSPLIIFDPKVLLRSVVLSLDGIFCQHALIPSLETMVEYLETSPSPMPPIRAKLHKDCPIVKTPSSFVILSRVHILEASFGNPIS